MIKTNYGIRRYSVKKNDKRFFNEMVVWVEETIKRTFDLGDVSKKK